MGNSKRVIPKHSSDGAKPVPIQSAYDFDYNKVLNPNVGGIKINIETWADTDKNTYYCWGDYWVKQKLQNALRKLFNCDCEVPPNQVDATIYLWGSNFESRSKWPYGYNRTQGLNIAWFYSHPDNMKAQELRKYPVVFCLSELYIPKLQKSTHHSGIMPEPLLSCTDFTTPNPIDQNIKYLLLEKNDYRADITFVGNARGALPYGRQAIKWLVPPENCKVQVYGAKWELAEYQNYIKTWYAGQYWPYEKLNDLYHNSKITLIDGHEDMNREGFVPMKLFDTLASAGFPLMVYNAGVDAIFQGTVEMYKDEYEMNEKIAYYLSHPEARVDKLIAGRQIALKHTYAERAKTFYQTILSKI